MPDPELEDRIVAAALRLLDRGGESAITLRSVAKEAGTTTPTIYERFRDRDALMRRLIGRATQEVLAALQPTDSIEGMFCEYLRFNRARPMRFNLMVETFGTRLVAGERMLVMELLMSRVAQQLGLRGRKREELTLAIASLAFGTARGMMAAGKDSRHAEDLQRASQGALRLLLSAFSGTQTASKRSGRKRPKQSRID